MEKGEREGDGEREKKVGSQSHLLTLADGRVYPWAMLIVPWITVTTGITNT